MRPELSGRSFIAFAGGDWWYHNRAHSDFQLLTRLARDHKVLLVNSIGMRMPLPGKTSQPFQKIWRKLKSVMRMLRQPVPGLPLLYVFSPLPFPLYRTATGRRFAAWFVRQQVRLAADWVGIRDPVIFLTPPTAWPVAKAMHAGSVVYNRSDKHSSFQEADRAYIQQLEQELLEGADLVLYASETLMQSEAARTRGRARHLDHGVEVELFRFDPPAREPQDLARIPKPRIGFFGGLRSFIVDFDLLAHVARSLPDAQLVLIGEAEAAFAAAVPLRRRFSGKIHEVSGLGENRGKREEVHLSTSPSTISRLPMMATRSASITSLILVSLSRMLILQNEGALAFTR